MEYEWDNSKNESNIHNHGIDFSDAWKIFQNPILAKEDNRKDYGEIRYISIGLLNDIEVVIIYTYRGQTIRIISIRKANKNERKIYQEAINK
jgi:uncharacterized DUF497 family protein